MAGSARGEGETMHTTMQEASSKAESVLRRAGYRPSRVQASYAGLSVYVPSLVEAERVSAFLGRALVAVSVDRDGDGYIASGSW